MANKSVVMASSLTGEAFEQLDVDFSDSDSWQVIDPSDSDDDNFSYGDVITTDDDDVVADDVYDVIALQHTFGSPLSDVSMQCDVDEIVRHEQEIEHACEINNIRHIMDHSGLINSEDDPHNEDEDEHDEHEDDDNDSDLDDELVPKWLNNKFERQRMRKLGKKANPKMKKCKRLAYMYNKPGCVHGKHGLGMKHNLMI